MYVFEKMTSGAYLGEVARLMMLTLAKDGILFQGVVPCKLEAMGSFPTSALAEIDADVSRCLSGSGSVLESRLQVSASLCDTQLVSTFLAYGNTALLLSQRDLTECW